MAGNPLDAFGPKDSGEACSERKSVGGHLDRPKSFYHLGFTRERKDWPSA
jgi:hypothetical protein